MNTNFLKMRENPTFDSCNCNSCLILVEITSNAAPVATIKGLFILSVGRAEKNKLLRHVFTALDRNAFLHELAKIYPPVGFGDLYHCQMKPIQMNWVM